MKRLQTAVLISITLALAAVAARADGVPPIVPTAGVLYGSQQKLITSSATVVFIDTTTIRLSALKGVRTSTITFLDGTVMASTTGITANTAWGAITGTLSNQSDLQTKLNAVGTSTAAIAASTGTLSVSTSSLKTQIDAVAVSTGLINTKVLAVAVDTGTINSRVSAVALDTGTIAATVNTLGVSTASLRTSTTSLQSQINVMTVSTASLKTQIDAVAVSTGQLRTSTTSLQSQITALPTASANNVWSGNNGFTSPLGTQFTYGISVATVTLSTPIARVLATDATGLIVSTVVPTAYGGTGTGSPALVAGTNISITGTWPNNTINANVTGAASTLGVTTGSASGFSTLITSPTAVINFESAQFTSSLKGAATNYMTLNQSSVTLAGNTFNNANQLVKLDGSSFLPAANGFNLTSLNASNIGSGTIGNVYLSTNVTLQGTNVINLASTLQSGATFYVSSGTASDLYANTISFGNNSDFFGNHLYGLSWNDGTKKLTLEGTLAVDQSYPVLGGITNSVGTSIVWPAPSQGSIGFPSSGSNFNSTTIGSGLLYAGGIIPSSATVLGAASQAVNGSISIGVGTFTGGSTAGAATRNNTIIGNAATANPGIGNAIENTVVGSSATVSWGINPRLQGVTLIGSKSGTIFSSGSTLLNATALGYNAQVSASSTVVLGDTTAPTNVVIGESAPVNRLNLLEVNGTIGSLFGVSAATAAITYNVDAGSFSTTNANGFELYAPNNSDAKLSIYTPGFAGNSSIELTTTGIGLYNNSITTLPIKIACLGPLSTCTSISGSTSMIYVDTATAGAYTLGLVSGRFRIFRPGTGTAGWATLSSSFTVTGPGGFGTTYGITSSTLTVTSTSTLTAVIASSITVTGTFQLPSATLAQLAVSTPTALGQKFFCSNCTTDVSCTSTQTVTAKWSGSTRAACQ